MASRSAVESLVTHAAWRVLAPSRIQRPFYESPPPPPVQQVGTTFVGFIPWCLRILRILLFASLLLLASTTSYAVLYQSLMPSQQVTAPLFFDYNLPPSVNSWRDLLLFRFVSHLWKRHCVPTASVDLFAQNPASSSWQVLHEAVAPPQVAQEHFLYANQAYYMEIVLQLPDAVVNHGLFGVVTHLSSSNGTALARSTRWVQVPHESAWIALGRKIICFPAYLVGAWTESRHLGVSVLRHYTESSILPLRYINVELLRYSKARPVIEVIQGEMLVGEEFNTYQEGLKEWYYTGFLVGSLSFAVLYLILALAVTGIIGRWGGGSGEEPPCDLDLDGSLGEDADFFEATSDPEPAGVHRDYIFEDWADHVLPSPAARTSAAPDNLPSAGAWEDMLHHPASGTSSVAARSPTDTPDRVPSESEWEDIFFPTSADDNADPP